MGPPAAMANDFNIIARFLALRDTEYLDRACLEAQLGLHKVDLLILLGNSLPYTAEVAVRAYLDGLADRFMIAGGEGHSTGLLREAVKRTPACAELETAGRTEAEILADIAVRAGAGAIRREELLLETASTNCGNNASCALRLLEGLDEPLPASVLLIQDPTMQRRSAASFEKVWSDAGLSARFVSFAPFIPQVGVNGGRLEPPAPPAAGAYVWDMGRFAALLMGEIPRLRDDADGYGPRGRGFIAHVDIPDEAEEAYGRLLPHYGGQARGIRP